MNVNHDLIRNGYALGGWMMVELSAPSQSEKLWNNGRIVTVLQQNLQLFFNECSSCNYNFAVVSFSHPRTATSACQLNSYFSRAPLLMVMLLFVRSNWHHEMFSHSVLVFTFRVPVSARDFSPKYFYSV